VLTKPSRLAARTDALVALALGLLIFTIYVATLAPSALRSDSGEFHVMPWVLGVAHAPGYPLLTLLGRLAMLLPIGDPAYRINLLDAAASAATVALVYLLVRELHPGHSWSGRAGGLVAAAALGLGATFWQQSLVGGPRPLIFLFTALLLWLGLRWFRRRRDRDLVLLAAALGLAISHHPNTLLLAPALAILVLGAEPKLLLQPRRLLLPVAALALPLLLYLYLPIRSAMDPPLGATNLANPRELLLYVTARHYQSDVAGNCGGSKLIQLQRYLVLLSLQFGPALAGLALLGGLATLVTSPLIGLALGYAFLSNAAFGICSTLAMPDYVIPSYVVAAVWLGSLASLALRPLSRLSAWPALAMVGLVALLSGVRLVSALPFQAMTARTTDLERARAGVVQLQSNGLLLADWESITPIWYAQHVEGINRVKSALVVAPPASDVWLVEAQKGLEDRPVTLAQWVPSFGETYRLFPVGGLQEVQERTVVNRVNNVGLRTSGRLPALLSYRLEPPVAAPGDLVHLTLYQSLPKESDDPLLPVLRIESATPVECRFDGALRTPTTRWQDDEVVGETYAFAVPLDAAPGPLPLALGYRVEGESDLIQRSGSPWLHFGSLAIRPPRPGVVPETGVIAEFAHQLALIGGTARAEGSTHSGGSAEPLRLRPGGRLDLELRWVGLRWMDDSYTLFVHLLDQDGRLIVQRDGLPLGGVFHTYKWVPGQVVTDWYQLPLPPDLPPGDYTLSIGAYHAMTTHRLPLISPDGGSDATSYTWGPIRVAAPGH
jgi:hypothetical protein